jgi:hypothetical protein
MDGDHGSREGGSNFRLQMIAYLMGLLHVGIPFDDQMKVDMPLRSCLASAEVMEFHELGRVIVDDGGDQCLLIIGQFRIHKGAEGLPGKAVSCPGDEEGNSQCNEGIEKDNSGVADQEKTHHDAS